MQRDDGPSLLDVEPIGPLVAGVGEGDMRRALALLEPPVGTTTTPVDRYDAILLTETVRENEIVIEFLLGYGDSASAEAALPSVEAMLAAGGSSSDDSFGGLFSGASVTARGTALAVTPRPRRLRPRLASAAESSIFVVG